MKTARPTTSVLLVPTVAVPVHWLPPESAAPGRRVIIRAVVDDETWMITGLESDRPATLAWLEELDDVNR